MPGNDITKILDLKGPLDGRSEEATPRGDKRSAGRQKKNVKLKRFDCNCPRKFIPKGRD
jgi:hypothetical protein